MHIDLKCVSHVPEIRYVAQGGERYVWSRLSKPQTLAIYLPSQSQRVITVLEEGKILKSLLSMFITPSAWGDTGHRMAWAQSGEISFYVMYT